MAKNGCVKYKSSRPICDPDRPEARILPDGRELARFRIYRDGVMVKVEQFTFSPMRSPVLKPILAHFVRMFQPTYTVKDARFTTVTPVGGVIFTREISSNEKLASLLYHVEITTDPTSRPADGLAVNEQAHEESHDYCEEPQSDTTYFAPPPAPSDMPVEFPARRSKAERKRMRQEMRRMVTPLPPIKVIEDHLDGSPPAPANAAVTNLRVFLFIEGEHELANQLREYTDRRIHYDKTKPPTIGHIARVYSEHTMSGRGHTAVPVVCYKYNQDKLEDEVVDGSEPVVANEHYRLKYYLPGHEILKDTIHDIIQVTA